MSTATVAYQELPPMTAWTADNQTPYQHDGSVMMHFNDTHQFDNGDHNWHPYPNDGSMHSNGSMPVEPTSPNQWSPQSPMGGMNGPPPAYNYARNSMYSTDLRAKKRLTGVRSGSTSSIPEELCLVCGDKASGYHYNALTCEGCKGFFRRSITRKAMYYCKYGGHCDIDMYMRRKCQACRLRKCLEIGMRPELVIPEEQCRLKRESKIKMRSTGCTSEERKSNSPQQVTSTENLSPNPTSVGLMPEQRELIHRLLLYQEQYDMPSDDDLTKLSTFGQNDNSGHNQHFQHLAELTILTVQLIVEFTKHLPGFLTLNKEDQLILLKACSTEVLMLKTAKRYDPKTDTIVLGNQTTSWSYSRDAYKQAGMGTATDAIFEFAKSMSKMKVDGVEYALLTAISIFSDRPGLVESRKVEDIQEVYTSTLQAYIDVHRPKNRTVFARLLMKLTDLRTLGSEQADVLFALKLQDTNGDTANLSNNNNDDSLTTNDMSVMLKSATKSSTSKKLASAKQPQQQLQPQQPVQQQQSSEISNSNEHTGQSTTSGYRMPNVRIKVEPLQSTNGMACVNVGGTMNGLLGDTDLHSTFEQHFSQQHQLGTQPDHHTDLLQTSCTFPEFTKMSNLYYEPHQ